MKDFWKACPISVPLYQSLLRRSVFDATAYIPQPFPEEEHCVPEAGLQRHFLHKEPRSGRQPHLVDFVVRVAMLNDSMSHSKRLIL